MCWEWCWGGLGKGGGGGGGGGGGDSCKAPRRDYTSADDGNSALDEMTDYTIGGIMSMFTFCAGKQTNVTQIR
jgi:hypothetical protein